MTSGTNDSGLSPDLRLLPLAAKGTDYSTLVANTLRKSYHTWLCRIINGYSARAASCKQRQKRLLFRRAKYFTRQ